MKEWQYVKLGDVCTIERGGSPRPIEKYITNDDSGINWIKIGDTTDSMYITKTEQKIIPDGMKKSRYVQAGDLLLSNSMSFGRPYILKIDGCIHDGWLVLRDSDNKFDKRFLYYYLSAPTTYEKFKNMAVGGVVNNLNSEMVRNVYVPIPSLVEQKEIAHSILKLDVLIEKRKQQLQKLDELVKARFVEMFGSLEENPQKYEVCEFADVVEYMCDIGSNGANKAVVEHLDMKDEEDYAMMVRFLNFTKNDFYEDVKYISKESYDFFRKSQVFGGELIICKIGSAGQSYIMPNLNRPVSLGLNQILVRVRENILMDYLYQYLHSDYGERLVAGCVNGAVTKSITKTELKKMPVVLPPIELQRRFVDFVQQINKSKLSVQQSLEKLETLKKALMQKYFG